MDYDTIEIAKGVGAVIAGTAFLGAGAFCLKLALANCVCDKRDYESNRFRYQEKALSTKATPMYEGDPRVNFEGKLSEAAVRSVWTFRGPSLVETEKEIISSLSSEEQGRIPSKLYSILGIDNPRNSIQ